MSSHVKVHTWFVLHSAQFSFAIRQRIRVVVHHRECHPLVVSQLLTHFLFVRHRHQTKHARGGYWTTRMHASEHTRKPVEMAPSIGRIHGSCSCAAVLFAHTRWIVDANTAFVHSIDWPEFDLSVVRRMRSQHVIKHVLLEFRSHGAL